MRTQKRAHVALWIVQALLAALFLFAGGFKLIVPAQALAQQTPLPVLFLRFIAFAEVLGALGLILPGLLRTGLMLTPIAAGGLVIIMIGATIVTIVTMGIAPAILPFVTGVLAACVAYGRWRIAPLRASAKSATVYAGATNDQ